MVQWWRRREILLCWGRSPAGSVGPLASSQGTSEDRLRAASRTLLRKRIVPSSFDNLRTKTKTSRDMKLTMLRWRCEVDHAAVAVQELLFDILTEVVPVVDGLDAPAICLGF
jgi:hypothetical protein